MDRAAQAMAAMESYEKEGRDFALDETLYRHGFEAALHPRVRGKAYAEAADFLRERYNDDHGANAFQRGYERGQTYHQGLMEKFPPK